MARFENSWFLARVSTPIGEPPRPPNPSEGSGRFSRQLDHSLVEVSYGGAARLAVDPERGLTVLVHGDVYDPLGPDPAQAVLDLYAKAGPATWKRLNSSSAVLVIDERSHEVMVVIDRVNSRKVFISRDAGGSWISTSLYRHPTEGCSIDPAAVGSLLTSGAVHSPLTPFQEVRSLARASVHSLRPQGVHSREYWQYEITGENRNLPALELRNRLIELLRESVRRRVQTVEGTCFVSMSGGYDSRSVAGFLTELVGPERVKAFTYQHGPPIGSTDAAVAAQTAATLGIEHQTFEVFDGDLMRLLDINARHGQGMKGCKETDFWLRLGPLMQEDASNALFVGDRFGGIRRRRHGGGAAASLALVLVYSPGVIGNFLGRLSPEAAVAIRDGWSASLEGFHGRIPDHDDPREAVEFAYLDQRIANYLTLWRECYQAPYTRVMNPYLDNDLLDFWGAVPIELRVGARLFKEAVEHALPDVFRDHVSTGGFGNPHLGEDLRSDYPLIEKSLMMEPTLLDPLVAPETILGVIETGSSNHAKTSVLNAGRRLKSRSSSARQALIALRSRVQPTGPGTIHWQNIAIRLLALRGFLATRVPVQTTPANPPHT